MRNYILLVSISLLSMSSIARPSYDELIHKKLKKLRLVPLEKSKPVSSDIFALGEAVFNDTLVSGNKNISCRTCHNPDDFWRVAVENYIGHT